VVHFLQWVWGSFHDSIEARLTFSGKLGHYSAVHCTFMLYLNVWVIVPELTFSE
jgi:hypothetical protein